MLDDTSSMITDAELSAVIHELRSESPTLGVTLVIGRLRSMGYKVTRERVRIMLRRADPLSSALRWAGGLSRRQPYSVAGPNSLWHIGESLFVHLLWCFPMTIQGREYLIARYSVHVHMVLNSLTEANIHANSHLSLSCSVSLVACQLSHLPWA